jgi:transcriptional regulator with XRE-family HTH domain
MLPIPHTINSFRVSMSKNMNKEILIKFGNNIRKIRMKKGMSQEQLSFKAELHRTYIGMVERAEKNITLLNIEKISLALEVEISELLK